MIVREEAFFDRARKVLGVMSGAEENEVRYAYYRRMLAVHPDRNPDDPCAHEMTALINEAFGLLMGKRSDVLLLKQDSLVTTLTESVATEIEGLLSYEEWIKQRFYNLEEKSIYAY